MDNKMESISHPNGKLFYPPGGILIWIVLVVEMITFIGALFFYLYYHLKFNADASGPALLLSSFNGTLYTVLLITSGYFMALTINDIKVNQAKRARKYAILTLIFGLLFIVAKGIEYFEKIQHGFRPGYSDEYSFYWFITGFHYVHVLFGIGLLLYVIRRLKRPTLDSEDHENIETIGIYWHMCDLIWIVIFPLMYLL